MNVILWIGGILGVIIAMRLFKFFIMLYELSRMEAKIDREGIHTTGKYDGMGYDPSMGREDGYFPARLIVRWIHPYTGATFEFRSLWFWHDPQDEDKFNNKDIPLKVVLSDPANLHRVEIRGLNLELFQIKLSFWKRKQ